MLFGQETFFSMAFLQWFQDMLMYVRPSNNSCSWTEQNANNH